MITLYLCKDEDIEAYHEIDLSEDLIEGVILMHAVSYFFDKDFCEDMGMHRIMREGDGILIEDRLFEYNGRAFELVEIFELDD